jgi:hypothetical protein
MENRRLHEARRLKILCLKEKVGDMRWGLSQNGAIGMARAGYTYDKILTHYFPGTVVE